MQKKGKGSEEMLIVKVKEGENIEKALRRFKRKVNETKLVQELRRRQEYRKPGEIRRDMEQKAIYRERLMNDIES